MAYSSSKISEMLEPVASGPLKDRLPLLTVMLQGRSEKVQPALKLCCVHSVVEQHSSTLSICCRSGARADCRGAKLPPIRAITAALAAVVSSGKVGLNSGSAVVEAEVEVLRPQPG